MTGTAGSNALAASEFVGRTDELSTLLAGLERVRAGRGALFLVGGEPGIGKSRLADEFAQRARAAGTLVLWGRAWEGGGAPAYWPWIQILRGHLRSVEPDVAHRHLGTGAADIVQMLPEIRSLLPDLPPSPPDSESARFRLFDSTSSMLRSVAADQPAVLVLDDLHAADTPSILLLRFLAGQLGDMRLLAIGTYRDVELTPDHPLTAALAEMAREPSSLLMNLEGLPEESVKRLIASAVGLTPAARLVHSLWRGTSGNPLFIEGAVRLLENEGQLDDVTSADVLHLAVPAGVRDVIARRVGQLPQSTARTLACAAALGPEFAVEVLRLVAECAPEDLVGHVTEALQAGLLAPVTGAVGRYRFSHDLIRESLYQGLSPSDRARLHLRIGQAVEGLRRRSLDAHLTELAHHYFEGVRGGLLEADSAELDEALGKALDYTRRAADLAASSLAFEEAARLYRMALSLMELDETCEDKVRTDVLLALGEVESRAGDLEVARQSFFQAAELARRAGEASNLARAALGSGGLLPWARPGNDTRLVPLLQEALVLLGGADEHLRARLLTRLACAWRSTPEQRQQSDVFSQQAVELARGLNDPATLGYALVGRFYATWWPNNPHEREALSEEMVALAENLGDGALLIDGHLLNWLMLSEKGELTAAHSKIEHVRQLADELRQPAHIWLGVGTSALSALLEGRFELASEFIQRELETEHPINLARDDESAATFHRFLLYRAWGRAAEVEPFVRVAAEQFPWYPLHRAALAVLLAELGRQAEAQAVLDALAKDGFAALYPDNEWLLGMSMAAEACHLLGDTSAAEVLYEQLEPYAGRHALGHAEGSVGSVDRYLGLLAMSLGRFDLAVTHLADAVRHNEQMGARPWVALSQRDLARVLRQRNRRGDQEQAEQLERKALAMARETGMTALADRLAPDEPVDAAAPVEASPGSFRPEGDYWTVSYGDDNFRLRDSKGLHYLARLLADPGREFLALDLAQGSPPAAGPGRLAAADDLGSVSAGDGGGPALDDQAKRAYRERLHELQAEIDEAEQWSDPERAERARTEMDFIARELAGAVGLGGRDRVAGSPIERARVAVTRAIRLAMTRIAGHSAPLADHLEATIHTGTYCVYKPDPRAQVKWQT